MNGMGGPYTNMGESAEKALEGEHKGSDGKSLVSGTFNVQSQGGVVKQTVDLQRRMLGKTKTEKKNHLILNN
jgi:hypothetical protein